MRQKAEFVYSHIRKNEYVTTKDGLSFFNGHYDDDSVRVHGDHPNGVHMDLTSQVFPIMFGVATDEQVKKTHEAVKYYLGNKVTGGLKLCSDFKEIKLNFGRVTGFVHGWRENGSIWNRMNVMYMDALYERNFVREGYTVLTEVMNLCLKSQQAKMLPNLPSTFNVWGRGMSGCLTGAPTWLVLGMVSQVFGVRGRNGDLLLNPKLVKEQFGKNGTARIVCNFQGKKLTIIYCNRGLLDWDEYSIQSVSINACPLTLDKNVPKNRMVVGKEAIHKHCVREMNEIEVVLG